MRMTARLLMLLAAVVLATGQGLKSRPGELRANNNANKELKDSYGNALTNAAAIAQRFKTQSATQKEKCAGGKGKLCAGSLVPSGNADDDAALLALGPSEWNWARPPGGRGGDILATINPFSTPRDQGKCGTCVSFAVVAAAEAAVARTLGLSGGSVSVSIQDHGFCPPKEGSSRFCDRGMDLYEGLNKLTAQALVKEECLKYNPNSLFTADTMCSTTCTFIDGNIKRGRNGWGFNFQQIPSIPQAQRHIRRFGGVLTPIFIDNDFRSFFAANPTGVYEGKGCDSGSDDNTPHAVVLVGYNNKEGYWVARNSWGQGFADGGYFRIKYGKCGVGKPVYGITWIPSDGVKIPFDVSPDATNPGCFIYRARDGDSISALADAWGVDPFDLLYTNWAEIEDIEKPIKGKTLRVCGITNNNVSLKTPGWVGH